MMSCDRHVMFHSDCAGCRHGREMSQAKDLAKQSERQHDAYMKKVNSEPSSFLWSVVKGASWFVLLVVVACVAYGFQTDGDIFEGVGAVLTFIFGHLFQIALLVVAAVVAVKTRARWVPAVRVRVANWRAGRQGEKGQGSSTFRVDSKEDFSA